MEVKFDVKMTQKIMYNFLMNHTYKSMAGIAGVLFGIGAFVIMAVTWGNVPEWQSMVYLLFGFWFLLYQPVSLYMKAAKQVKLNPTFQKPVTYIISETGITTMQGDKPGGGCLGGYGEGYGDETQSSGLHRKKILFRAPERKHGGAV